MDTGSSEVDKVWMEATTQWILVAVRLTRCGWRPQPSGYW